MTQRMIPRAHAREIAKAASDLADKGLAWKARAQAERAAIVAFLRQGGERDARGWYTWDSEMRGYAASFADRIERGDHLSEISRLSTQGEGRRG